MSSQDPQAASVVPPNATRDLPQKAHPPSERRGRTRHSLSVPAGVRLRGPGIVATPTRIVDLSEDGIGLETSTFLPPDRTLALDLDLSPALEGHHGLRLIGQVAWSQPTGRSGVRFFSPDHAALQEIQQWLFLNAVAGAAETSRLPELLSQASQLTGIEGSLAPEIVPQKELFLDEESVGEPDGAILSPLDHSPLLRDTNAIVSRALALTGAKGAALALYEGGHLICRAICGTDTPALGARISTDSGITGECVRFAQVMYCSDAAADPRVDREICADLGIRSILALPLFAGERVVGLLEVLSQRTEAFDPGDAKALDLLARPVMGMLFAEGASLALRRGVGSDVREPDLGFGSRDRDSVDLDFIERQHRAITRTTLPGVRIYRRVLEGVAAIAVIAAVTWLVMSQTKTLTSLQQQPAAATTQIQPQVPHAMPVSAEVGNETGKITDGKPATDSLADLKAAAQDGDLSAQYAVGARYASGEGVPQDYAAAARWFTLAAKKGYAPAQGMLGACYWSGRGVPKDLKQAYFWSVLARDGKDEISKDRVDALVARLNRSQMLEVQQLVRDWYRKQAASPQAASSLR